MSYKWNHKMRQLYFHEESLKRKVTFQTLDLEKQEGNGPIDLRRQGQWEIGMWCCMISINPTLNYLGGHLTSYLKSATLITLVFMCILPQMASEAMATSKRPRRSFDLRFEISNLDYPGIHVHIASNGLRGHGDLLMTSEVIWPQIWNQQPWLPWYPCA